MTRLGSFPPFLKEKSVGGSVLLELKHFGLAFTPNAVISEIRSKIAIDWRFLGAFASRSFLLISVCLMSTRLKGFAFCGARKNARSDSHLAHYVESEFEKQVAFREGLAPKNAAR